jgi:hypothetical protein
MIKSPTDFAYKATREHLVYTRHYNSCMMMWMFWLYWQRQSKSCLYFKGNFKTKTKELRKLLEPIIQKKIMR